MITILDDVVNGPVSNILWTVDGVLNGVTPLVGNLYAYISTFSCIPSHSCHRAHV